MTESFQFVHPEFLSLLLLLPVLAIWKGRWGRPVAVRMPSTDDAISVGARPRSKAGAFLAFFGLLSFALLIIAFARDRKSTRLNSSHQINSYAVFCLKKKKVRNHESSY